MEQSQTTTMAPQPTIMGPQPGMMMVMHLPVESCKGNSKVVASLDMFVGVANFLFFLIFVVGLSLILTAVDESIDEELNKTVSEREEKKRTVRLNSYIIIGTSAVGIVVTAIEVFFAYGLYTVTKIVGVGYSPTQSLPKAKSWRCYHIFLIIFTLITAGIEFWIRGGIGSYHFLCAIFHCVCIFIVHRYIQDLNRVGEAPMVDGGNPVPMAYTSTQYQQNSWPTQYQQQAQYQQQSQQFQ